MLVWISTNIEYIYYHLLVITTLYPIYNIQFSRLIITYKSANVKWPTMRILSIPKISVLTSKNFTTLLYSLTFSPLWHENSFFVSFWQKNTNTILHPDYILSFLPKLFHSFDLKGKIFTWVIPLNKNRRLK